MVAECTSEEIIVTTDNMSHSTVSREEEIAVFLADYFTKGYSSIFPIPGDAGLRSYFRIIDFNNQSYILMDCPVWYCSIEPFIVMAEHLIISGFSAPRILAHELSKGLLLLEDFGDISVNKLLNTIDADSIKQESIYFKLVELIIAVQNIRPPATMNKLNNHFLLQELAVFVDYYVPYSLKRTLTSPERKEFTTIWQEILENRYITEQNSLILMDYHVDNIMFLPEKVGLSQFGLLDFQDALLGSPVYDLVSLLEDARIEVSRDLAISAITYFAKLKNISTEAVIHDYHILGAQRNLRILGVFARKYLKDENASYLQYLPRVLKYLEYDLSHPATRKLRLWLTSVTVQLAAV